jgi:hypothetical protein
MLGGAITAGSSFLIERRRDRRDEEREKNNRLRLIKQAARVVDAELEDAERGTTVAVQRGRWW